MKDIKNWKKIWVVGLSFLLVGTIILCTYFSVMAFGDIEVGETNNEYREEWDVTSTEVVEKEGNVMIHAYYVGLIFLISGILTLLIAGILDIVKPQ